MAIDWKKLGRQLKAGGEGFAGRGPQYQAALAAQDRAEAFRRAQEDQERRARNAALMKGGQELAQYTYGQMKNSLDRGEPVSQDVFREHLRGIAQMGRPMAQVRQFANVVLNDSERGPQELKNYIADASQVFGLSDDADIRGRMGNTGQLATRTNEAGDIEYGRAIPIFDPKTQTVRNDFVPLGEGVVPVDTLGLDPAGRVSQKRREALATTEGKGQGQRSAQSIETGINAARGMPVLRRTRSLLEEVKTGGLARAKLAVENFFGVTGADEAELSANMGRAVLSQLKNIFGAQFTEREGERLASIEARFGNSTAGNIRLIEGLMQMAEQEARTAIDYATRMGDEETVRMIDSYMNMRLRDESGNPVTNARSSGSNVEILSIRRQ